ncbi:MAG: LysR family transcriptional regulator [Acidobacteriota bacterium]
MELELLRTFSDVFRRRSFAAVARDRNVDPSTISRAISGLEAELGVRLFHRTTRRLSPTEAGAIYFRRVEPLIEELEYARWQAVDVSERPTGTLRIAAPVSFAQLNLVPLLPELSRRYPDLRFDLELIDAAPDLLEARIDVALRLGPLADSGLIARRLAPMVARACASPAYLERRGRPRVPSDLAQHDCLLLDMPGFGDRWSFRDPDGVVTEVRVPGRLHTSNAVALKQCAVGGMGVILQGRWIVGRELQDGRLVDLFPDHEATAATFEAPAIWVIYPSRSYLPLKVRVFLDFLDESFAAGPPWDRPPEP